MPLPSPVRLRRTRGGSGLAPLGAVLSLAIGLYIFFSTAAMVVHGWSAIPYWDQWDDLIHTPGQVFSPWLFSQHNEHRILFPRLFFAVDTFAVAATNRFNFFCNLALPLALAGLMITLIHRQVGHKSFDIYRLAGVVLAGLFSAMQYENFLWGFEVIYFLIELAGAIALACLVFGQPSWSSLTWAVLLSTVAVYTLASGIIVPFLAIPIAILVRRSWPQITVLCVAAIALLSTYVDGYVSPSGHSNPLSTVLQPAFFLYAFTELGNPLGVLLLRFHIPRYLEWDIAFGAAGAALTAAAWIVLLRRVRARRAPELWFLALATWCVGTALLTALGRLKFGYEQALSSRYSSPMLLFWLSLGLLAIIRSQDSRARLQPLTTAPSMLLLVILAIGQPKFVKAGLAWAAERHEATTALLADVDDPAALVRVHPAPDWVWQQAVELKAKNRSIFAAKWSTWLGSPLGAHARLLPSSRCRGEIDTMIPVTTGVDKGWRISGWAWDDLRSRAFQRLVIADDIGQVIGYALGGVPPGGGRGPRRSGWTGHFFTSHAGSIIAYALVDEGQFACAVATAALPDRRATGGLRQTSHGSNALERQQSIGP